MVRVGVNRTNLLDTLHQRFDAEGKLIGQNPNGSLDTFGGYPATFQHKNKAIVLTSPLPDLNYTSPERPPVTSVQTTIGFFDLQDFEKYQPKPTWEIYIDDQRVTSFPATAKADQRIAIRDGVTYIGVIPLPSTSLHRYHEVVITDQTGPDVNLQSGGRTKPALLIEQFLYQSNEPMPLETQASKAVDLSYGGFVIEMGDAAEHGDFASFQKHLRDAKVATRAEETAGVWHISHNSGADMMECGFRPDFAGRFRAPQPAEKCFPYRRVNGHWAYPAPGIDRDSPVSQQGTTGRLEKSGAVLTCEPGPSPSSRLAARASSRCSPWRSCGTRPAS